MLEFLTPVFQTSLYSSTFVLEGCFGINLQQDRDHLKPVFYVSKLLIQISVYKTLMDYGTKGYIWVTVGPGYGID